MHLIRKLSSPSNVLRVTLRHSTTGVGLTGLTSASSGLIISTIADNEATATVYTAAGSTVEGITTLGTFAAPTATKCRFKEVDSANHKGLYELQIADARFAVSGAKQLDIAITGATNLLDKAVTVQFDPVPADAVRVGGTTQTGRDIGASVLLSSGTGTGQVKLAGGYVAPNWGDIGNPTTSVYLSGTAIKNAADLGTDLTLVKARVELALPNSAPAVVGGLIVLGTNAGGLVLEDVNFQSFGVDAFNVSGTSFENIVWGATVRSLNEKTGFSLLGTTTTLDALQTALSTAHGAGSWLASDVWSVGTRTVTGGTIGTVTGLTIANVENMATRVLGMIELDGSVYRYTANALEQGPAGGGGGGGGGNTAQEMADALKTTPAPGTPAANSAYAILLQIRRGEFGENRT